MCTNTEDAAVVSAIIYLANNFRLDVVAEGIETEQQERLLRTFDCQYGQGFLFARPMPADDLRAILADHAIDVAGERRAIGSYPGRVNLGLSGSAMSPLADRTLEPARPD